MSFGAGVGRLPLAMALTLLPAVWRRKLGLVEAGDLRAPALVSGILQVAACAALIALRYPAFVRSTMAGQSME